MIKLSARGTWEKTTALLKDIQQRIRFRKLHQFGERGVEALSQATPVDTGKTAASWRYEVKEFDGGAEISFHNDNVNNYVNIALILQYGHGTGTGGWVQGRDYINPAIQPIFDEMAETLWKEVVG